MPEQFELDLPEPVEPPKVEQSAPKPSEKTLTREELEAKTDMELGELYNETFKITLYVFPERAVLIEALLNPDLHNRRLWEQARAEDREDVEETYRRKPKK